MIGREGIELSRFEDEEELLPVNSAGGDVDDDEVIAGNGAETDGVGRVGVGGPMPGSAGVVEHAGLGQEVTHVTDGMGSEEFVVAEGEFEDGALEVVEQEFEVVGIDEGVFGRLAEEVFGVFDDVLVDGRG